MSWQITGRARVNPERPKAFAVCDRCQFLYNRDDLTWQYEWQFQKIHNRRILVCPTCHDRLQEQLRRIVLPIDPVPIQNPRVGEFGAMIISSNPDPFATIVPSYLTTEPFSGAAAFDASFDPSFLIAGTGPFQGAAGLILVTELSCIPIVTEVTNTPVPNGYGDGSYSGGPDSNNPGLNTLLGGNST